jgi:hypothetical protein
MKTEKEKMLAGVWQADPDRLGCLGRRQCRGLPRGDDWIQERDWGGQRVTRDIPEGVFTAGNPCKVIRKLE